MFLFLFIKCTIRMYDSSCPSTLVLVLGHLHKQHMIIMIPRITTIIISNPSGTIHTELSCEWKRSRKVKVNKFEFLLVQLFVVLVKMSISAHVDNPVCLLFHTLFHRNIKWRTSCSGGLHILPETVFNWRRKSFHEPTRALCCIRVDGHISRQTFLLPGANVPSK